jgi:hypothetical protein
LQTAVITGGTRGIGAGWSCDCGYSHARNGTDQPSSVSFEKRTPEKKTLIRIYNILANDVETVTPFLVKRMTGNTKNGVKISFLTAWKVIWRFISAPVTNRDVVSKYLLM